MGNLIKSNICSNEEKHIIKLNINEINQQLNVSKNQKKMLNKVIIVWSALRD